MQVTTGSRWRSQVCETEVIVVRAPAGGQVELTCGGTAMVPLDTPPADAGAGATSASAAVPAAGLDGGSELGKRYTNPAGDLEVLVTKPGKGTLAVGADPLARKQAKPLPSSD